MAEISSALVKELREETNVGMMECKKALVEAGGDKAKALRILRERGAAIAAKKASRSANQGVVAAFISEDTRLGGMVEINCETDFVAKNEKFIAFAREAARKAAETEGDIAGLMAEAITAKIAEIGENIVLRRSARFAAQQPGATAAYIHYGNTIGVLVECGCGKPETTRSPDFAALMKDLAMQVAAAAPRYVAPQDVPAEVLTAEREIYAKQITGKPRNIIEKIVDGKIAKFYEQVCLNNQPFIKDDKQKISAVLKSAGAKTGDSIFVRRFARFQVGEKN